MPRVVVKGEKQTESAGWRGKCVERRGPRQSDYIARQTYNKLPRR